MEESMMVKEDFDIYRAIENYEKELEEIRRKQEEEEEERKRIEEELMNRSASSSNKT